MGHPQRRGTARNLPNFCVVLCIVCFMSFSVLFVCICVLYYCHRVATQLQLNISYHISYHTITHHIKSATIEIQSSQYIHLDSHKIFHDTPHTQRKFYHTLEYDSFISYCKKTFILFTIFTLIQYA